MRKLRYPHGVMGQWADELIRSSIELESRPLGEPVAKPREVPPAKELPETFLDRLDAAGCRLGLHRRTLA